MLGVEDRSPRAGGAAPRPDPVVDHRGDDRTDLGKVLTPGPTRGRRGAAGRARDRCGAAAQGDGVPGGHPVDLGAEGPLGRVGPKCATRLWACRRGGGPTRRESEPHQSSRAISARNGVVGRHADSPPRYPPAATADADDRSVEPDAQECHGRGLTNHRDGRDRRGDQRCKHKARMRDRVGCLAGTQGDQAAPAPVEPPRTGSG